MNTNTLSNTNSCITRGSSIGRYDTFDKSTQEAEQKLEEERQQSYNCTRDTFIMPFSEAEALIEAVRSASNPNIDSKDCEDSQAAEFCRLTSTDNSTIQSTVPFDANNQKGSGIALQPNQNASLKQLSRDPLYDDPWAAMESVLGSSTAIEKKKSDFGSGRQISTSAETAHDVAGLTFIKRKSILWLKDISSVGNLNKSKNKEDADIDNFADITEELWFENERNGSLDQSALEDIQKQLFGVAGARHLHDSDDADKESCTLNAETTSDKNALTRIFPDVLDDSTSPDKTSNLDNRHDQDNLGSLSLTLPLEGPVNISSAECNFSPKRGHRAYSSLENSPAHRQQHSPNFLLKAGLLVEDEGGYQLAKEDEYKDVKGSLINDNIQLEPRTLPTNPSSAIRKAAIKNNFFTGSVSDMQQNSMDPIGIGYEDYLARLPNNENEIRKDKERSDSQFSVDGVPKSRTQSHSSVMSISKHSLGRSRDDSFSSTQAGRVLEQILISDDNYFNSVAASNAVEDNDQDVVESQNEYRSVSDTTCGESQSENGVQPNFISPSSYPNSSAIEEEYRKELERWEEFKVR